MNKNECVETGEKFEEILYLLEENHWIKKKERKKINYFFLDSYRRKVYKNYNNKNKKE